MNIEVSKEVNEIINNLCDKLGTSAKFLIPEMAKLNIAQGVFKVIFTAIMLTFCGVTTVKAWKYDHRDGAVFLEDSCFTLIPAVIGTIMFIIFSISLYGLIGWLSSPTAMAIKEIMRMFI